MRTLEPIDRTDAKLLLALNSEPRATVLALAQDTGLSRNTVQARLSRYEETGVLESFDRRIVPASLGYSLTAFIFARVIQRELDHVADELTAISEVIEVIGLSGEIDLLIRVVAINADDLYRIAGHILAINGVERTETGLAMRRLVDYRITQLLHRAVNGRAKGYRA